MIRGLLPPDDQIYIALDAALRQGDVLSAQRHLADLQNAPADPSTRAGVALRLATVDYLACQHDRVLAEVQDIQPDAGHIAAAMYFLAALAAIDLKQEQQAAAALAAAEAAASDPRYPCYVALARATLALYLGRYDDADEWLTRAAQAGGGDAWAALQTFRLQGLLAHQRTDHSAALEYLNRAQAGYAAVGDRYETSRCHKALANVYRHLEARPAATSHIEAAIAYFAGQGLSIPLARCQNTLGAIQLYFNRHQQALASFGAAAAHLEPAGLQLELAYTLNNMALTYGFLGHVGLALSAYDRARSLATGPGMAGADAEFARNQALLFKQSGQLEEASARLQHAGQVFVDIGAPATAANCWRYLAECKIEMGLLPEAAALLQESSRIFLEHRRPAQAALNGVNLARIHLLQGQPALAAPLLETCAALLRAHDMPHEAAEADIWLGQVHEMAGDHASASDCYNRALDGAAAERVARAWRAYNGLAQALHQRGEQTAAMARLQQAIDHLGRRRRGALSPQAASRLAAESAGVYTQAVALALELEQPAQALATLEDYKALHVAAQLQAGRDRRRPPGQVHELHEALLLPDAGTLEATGARLMGLRVAMQAAAAGQAWPLLHTLEQEYQGLAERLAAINAPYASLYEPQHLDLPELRRRLDARHGAGHWACLAFGWWDQPAATLHRFWLDSSRLQAAPAQITLLDRRLVDLACRPERSYRRRMLHWSSARTGDLQPPQEWERLERLLLPASLTPYLAGIDVLYVTPSGPLASFPFAALRHEGGCLGLTLALSHVPSLPTLQALLRRSEQGGGRQELALPDSRGLVCAVSHYDASSGLPALDATAGEAAHLRQRLGPDSLLLQDQQATRSAFTRLRAEGSLAEFDLLHFAAHAQLHPHQSQLSRILLHDDALYVSDILSWELTCRLAALAACDTAIGHVHAGDEQMGLPHAFLVAGASTLLAALWPVEDRQTAEFLRRFYDGLAEAASPGKALRSARRAAAAAAPAPYGWSAFTLLGLI